MLLTTIGSVFFPFLQWWPEHGLWSDLVLGTSRGLNSELQHSPELRFQLRHQHAVSSNGSVVFANVHDRGSSLLLPGHKLRAKTVTTYRPSSLSAFQSARLRSQFQSQSEALHWDEEEVPAPDVENRATLLELAKMTYNAYIDHNDTSWYDLDGKWNAVRT
jgi:putative lipase involved disintegration of autophagic bodies